MSFSEIQMLGLRLTAPDRWIFAPVQGCIMARAETRRGFFRVKPVSPVPNPTPELLEKILQKWIAPRRDTGPFAVKKPVSQTHWFGGASFCLNTAGKKFFIRGWYLYRKGNLALAAYGCRWSQRESEGVRQELQQCERMVLSIQFAPVG